MRSNPISHYWLTAFIVPRTMLYNTHNTIMWRFFGIYFIALFLNICQVRAKLVFVPISSPFRPFARHYTRTLRNQFRRNVCRIVCRFSFAARRKYQMFIAVRTYECLARCSSMGGRFKGRRRRTFPARIRKVFY